jgi:hypothetical protein
MPTVAILPWLNLRQPITVGDYTLTPVQSGHFADSAEAQVVARSVVAHYETHKHVVHNPAILHFAGRPLTADLSTNEETTLFDFVELVAFAGLASRSFFDCRNTYCNRDQFYLAVFHINRPDGDSGLRYTVRRRDRSVTIGADRLVYRVYRPSHVGVHFDYSPAVPLLNAVLSATSHEEWPRLFEAILNFNLANTDSPALHRASELVLHVSAFQRLLDSGSNHNALQSALNRHLAPSRNLALASAADTPAEWIAQQASAKGFRPEIVNVRDAWLRDLVSLRDNAAHGKLTDAYKPIWTIDNHLLLSAYLFPLLIKSGLGSLGHYVLTGDDHFDLDVFEQLACMDHYAC